MEEVSAIETKFLVITTVPGFMEAADIVSKLRAKYDGVTYDVSNATGMAKAIFARKELRDARIALDKKKPEVKREALDFCNKVEADYKAIRAAVSEYEDIPDAAIKAEEERKEAEKAEKARIAAAAQKILDDKIVAIGQIPLSQIGVDSAGLTSFIAVLEARPFGGEFTGDTLTRAEAAKAGAVATLRDMLAATIKAEEIAAALKAEQEAEAVRLEAARVERETAEKLQREANEKLQAELAEQKRLQDIEAARLAELAEVENKRLAAERAAFEKEQKDAADKQSEIDRVAREKQAAIDAETKRIQDEEAAKQREIERQAAIVAEQSRIEAEKARKVAEKKAKLLAARCDNAEVALIKILDICRDNAMSPAEKVEQISLIAEASK